MDHKYSVKEEGEGEVVVVEQRDQFCFCLTAEGRRHSPITFRYIEALGRDQRSYARLGESYFHRSKTYECVSYYKAISRVFRGY